jgi:hypothetical protein
MAAPTNTYQSTAAVGNREDLTDVISRISPSETPFLSMIGTGKATNTLHEFQTQSLQAPGDNAQAEGDDATNNVVTPTVRLQNRTQISSKTVQVSGTQEQTDSAGRKSEMAYQMALKSAELKTDIEFGLTQNGVSAAGPRKSRGLIGWVDSANANGGTGYVAPNYVTNVAQTDGTTRPFTETLLKDVLQKCYTSGGNPNVIMLGPIQKQAFSTFTGNSTRRVDAEDEKIYASIDVYVSDFGTLKVVPNRIQRARDVHILESGKWKMAWFRPYFTQDLAKTGDSIRKQIICEYTLEAVNPKANGIVADVQ